MYRLTARLLLVLLLAAIFVPVAMAISAPLPHACCMRKPLDDHGSGRREIRDGDGQNHNCCPPVTTAHWAQLGPGADSNVDALLNFLAPASHPVLHSDYSNSLQPVRGPPVC